MDEKYIKLTQEWHKRGYEVGAQSRQAEIDALKKRINEALRYVIDHGGYDDLTHVINILKGNQND